MSPVEINRVLIDLTAIDLGAADLEPRMPWSNPSYQADSGLGRGWVRTSDLLRVSV
jgi:hypothetical protein